LRSLSRHCCVADKEQYSRPHILLESSNCGHAGTQHRYLHMSRSRWNASDWNRGLNINEQYRAIHYAPMLCEWGIIVHFIFIQLSCPNAKCPQICYSTCATRAALPPPSSCCEWRLSRLDACCVGDYLPIDFVPPRLQKLFLVR